jgi:SAM-dependent methyltransferase
MNFFSYKSAAERYPKGRPYFHPLVVERIKTFLSLTGLTEHALDVGCGTGLSSVALKEIAASVVGADVSQEMIALAEKDDRVVYAVADAVRLPFREEVFDLATLSSAFHWLDRREFLREAARVLRPRGWLVVYDHYFSGRMTENEEFQTWYRETHLKRYPAPPRARLSFTEEDSGNEGFHLAGHEHYRNSIRFPVEGLIDYLTTHSNVIAMVEGGTEEVDEVRRWLQGNLAPLFGELKEATFLFYGPIWYLQRPA